MKQLLAMFLMLGVSSSSAFADRLADLKAADDVAKPSCERIPKFYKEELDECLANRTAQTAACGAEEDEKQSCPDPQPLRNEVAVAEGKVRKAEEALRAAQNAKKRDDGAVKKAKDALADATKAKAATQAKRDTQRKSNTEMAGKIRKCIAARDAAMAIFHRASERLDKEKPSVPTEKALVNSLKGKYVSAIPGHTEQIENRRRSLKTCEATL